MAVELMLLAVNTNFIAFAAQWQHIVGQVFALFVLAVAAAEAAIALALVVVYFRQADDVATHTLTRLKG
jgi:NADH-quinone oxidoreductase subunit K